MARYPTVRAVTRWHDYWIGVLGGAFGVRDAGLLESAVNSPRFVGQYETRDPVVQAAALCHAIAKNHAFLDGNKRAAFAALICFLSRNGYDVNFIDETWADIIEGVADGRLSRDQLADIIRRALPRRTRR